MVTHASHLMLCLLFVGQSFVIAVSPVMAQRRADTQTSAPAPRAQTSKQFETPNLSQGALTDMEIQSQRRAAFRATSASGVAPSKGTPIVAQETNPLAPSLLHSFETINFNEDATLNGVFHIPPDPAGAAGPAHVVNVVNTSIEWHTKAGVRQNRQRLDAFFASLTPANNTFDPKVIYDQYMNRFLVVTLERVDTSIATGNSSRILVAVSDDSDPNGTWFFHAINSNVTITGNPSWADFPGFAVDAEAVYITANQFRFAFQGTAFAGVRLWIIPKASFYAGTGATSTIFDPALEASNNPLGDGAEATTMQPTQMYGDAPGGVGTYLVSYSGLNDGTDVFLQIVRIDSPLSSPVFTGAFTLWGTAIADDNVSLALPSAPQMGTARLIATNDRRISQNPVWRNDMLYCAASIRPPATAAADAGQTTAHWFKVDTTTLDAPGDAPPVDQGNVGGEDIAAGTFTFFPTVAVDLESNLAIGFSASGPNIFPGAYYTGRLADDPPGTTQPAAALRAGVDYYIRTFQPTGTPASRWGDYTGIWLDPSNETSFWVFNEYALTRGSTGIGPGSAATEDGRWGTAFGSFSLVVANAGHVIISEFRLRGPNGANDEFIELYNNTDAPIVVNDVNSPSAGPSGWALVSADTPLVAKAIVPNGTTIPARGHYLITNSAGYSLAAYPAGHHGGAATTATGDLSYTTDIPDNQGLALFRSANPLNYTLVDRLDAVGSTSETNVIYKEGAGYPPIMSNLTEYSLVRRMPGGCTGSAGSPGSGHCTTAALVQNTSAPSSPYNQDTDDNAADFLFVDTNGTSAGAGQRLGAPGPENLSSPVVNAARQIIITTLDPAAGSASPPNRVRDTTPDAPNNSTLGTLDIRRRLTNQTGANVTRLRFRIVDITTFPSISGVADLRPRTSGQTIVTLSNGSMVTVEGTTLETPPSQPNGGGYNSTLAAGTITLATPLANGESIIVRFLLGVQQAGKFRFFVNTEALP